MKGTKPDFHDALEGGKAREIFDKFVERVRSKYKHDMVHTGAFGQLMDVHIRNDGPVTLIWESDKPKGAEDQNDEICEKS